MRIGKWFGRVTGITLLVAVSVLGLARFASAQEAAPAAGAAAPAAGAAGTLAVTDTNATKSAEVPTMDFYHVVFKSGWFGVCIWMMLFVSSIAMVALVVDSYINIRELKIAPPTLVQGVREAMEQGDVLKAIQRCEQQPGPLSSILSAGFSNVKEGFEVIQDSISVAADLEGEKLMQRVTYLSVISNITPMLGLIGTVQGMIYAFFTLGTQSAGAAQQAMLAVNISHGLWATAIGLGTSVPATIWFFYFKNKAMRIILGMEAMTLDLVKALRNVEVVVEE